MQEDRFRPSSCPLSNGDFPVRVLFKGLWTQPSGAGCFNIGRQIMQHTPEQLLELIRGLAAELHPRQAHSLYVTLDSLLDRDLGFDSLSRIELVARLEKAFNISLPEQAAATSETPRDLLRAVDAASPAMEQAVEWAPDRRGSGTAAKGIPHGAGTLVDVLAWHAREHGDLPHIRLYEDRGEAEVLSYRDLWEGGQDIAQGLGRLGVEPGNSVLVMLPTGRDYFHTFFGVLMAGGVPVPVYPPGRVKQIREHLQRHTAIAENCGARVMVSMPEALQFSQFMKSSASHLQHVTTCAELIAGSGLAGRAEPLPLKSGDTAFIQYTSGSTGSPKGVVLSHANLLANVRAMGAAVRVTPEDVFVSWLPLYHDMGLIGAWLGSLYHACPLVIMSPLSFLARPERWLRAIHQYGGTLSAAPNFAYDLCVRRIEDADIEGIDLSSWRGAFNGAEPVSPATLRRFSERFARFGFRSEALMPVYGLAENSVGVAFPPLSRGPRVDRIERDTFMRSGQAVPAPSGSQKVLEFVSCGLPIPGHEIRVIDEQGEELGERREGRLQFRGPSSTSGYFRNAEATRGLMDGNWLNSGDRAYMVEGEVHITGRTKDIVIKAGRNIYPQEVEEWVGGIPGIRQGNVAVFGTLEESTGTERLVVVAESRRTDAASVARLTAEVNARVNDAIGSPPDDVVIAPPNAVLKTSSGKVRRAATRRLYETGHLGKPPGAVWVQVARFWLEGFFARARRIGLDLGALGYAGWSWLVIALLAPAVWTLLLLLPAERPRWRVVATLSRLCTRLLGIRVTAEGLGHLPSREAACIYVSNHSSYIDSMILPSVLPPMFSYVAKAELMRNPLLKWVLRRLAVLPVERFDRTKSLGDSRRINETASAGRSLLFFPEGTFVRAPGLLPFRMGAFEAAAFSGLSVVPVAIRGTRAILRSGSWRPRRGHIRILIGPPIAPDAGEPDMWKRALLLRERARAWILSRCGEPDLEHERPALLTGPGTQPPSHQDRRKPDHPA